MTNVTVSSGVSSGGLSFNAGSLEYVYGTAGGTRLVGGTEIVFSGGQASGTLVSYEGEGGQEIVSSGGSASYTVVSYGGQEIVSSGGSASFDTVSYGGSVTVTSGGVDSFATVSMGGTQTVLGGSAVSTTILSDGLEIIASGGVAAFTSVTYFGTAQVSAGGTSISATVVSAGASEQVYSGGVASAAAVASGGVESVYASGVAISTTVGNSGTEDVDGGSASFITVGSGGALAISAGGTAVSAAIGGGGSYGISSGGSGLFATLSSGGAETVYSGGRAISTTVDNDGAETVSFGGTAIGAMLNSNGGQYVSGTASFTQVSSGGDEFVYSGGTTVSTTVSSGGAEFLFSGTASGTVLDSGGYLVVLPGATETDTVVSGGMVVSTGVVLVRTDPVVSVDNAADTQYNLILTPGLLDPFFEHQETQLEVMNGGSIFNTTLFGVDDHIFGGGLASGTILNDGAVEYVQAQGIAIGTTVSAQGVQVVSGPFQYESAGGLLTESGGTASSTTVNSGGTLEVHSGGNVSGATILPGGKIDLPDLVYASGGSATVNSSGLLTVQVPAGTYTQQLAGNFANEHFTLSNDGLGYVLVTAQAGAACFARGTRIAAEKGEVDVETLRAGDRVRTREGVLAPIVWVGQRRIDCRRHPDPGAVYPIRIRAHTFGDGAPARDLFLSPDHAVFLDGVLVPIKLLVDGAAIAPVPVTEVEYFHIELPDHEVILAEGLEVESYLNTGDDKLFGRDGQPIALFPALSRRAAGDVWETRARAPLVVTGPKLTELRRNVRNSHRPGTATAQVIR